jgi:hypothetical protein
MLNQVQHDVLLIEKNIANRAPAPHRHSIEVEPVRQSSRLTS